MDTAQSFAVTKYAELCNFLEGETIGTAAAIYGASGLMLLVAYAKRRPAYLVRQFKKPDHIPEQLIKDRTIHTGLIKGIQQRGADTLLLINHRPLIPLFASRDRVLPVKLPGVQVNANGYAWLQNCWLDHKATFIPLSKNKSKDYIVCQMCLVHPPKGNRLLDISETLLKLRFAKYAPDALVAPVAKQHIKYYKHLQRIEASTQTKEAWLAWAARYPWLLQALTDLKASILPKQKLLPELVR